MQKTKITKEGQPCRKCGYPVVKKIPRRRKGARYYYNYYLYCKKCGMMYMLPSEKVYFENYSGRLLAGEDLKFLDWVYVKNGRVFKANKKS